MRSNPAPSAVLSARALPVSAGATAYDRLRRYLPEPEALAGATLADAVAAIVDAPGPAADGYAVLLRACGGGAWPAAGRVVVAGSVAAFGYACERAEPAVAPLAHEVLRAVAADRGLPAALRLRSGRLDLAERARVMGILNVTPDSFFERGRYLDLGRARERAAELVAEGADLIDIGGHSYSAENGGVDPDEEARRVVPVVEALATSAIGIPLSVDTYRASVAERVLAAGAALINDCSGLSDERMAAVVAREDAALVVMHLRGRLNVREPSYVYGDALGEIVQFLRDRTQRAIAAGVAPEAIVVDPGLEFGKELDTDLEVLANFGDLRSLGFPLLLAASRKSFLGKIFAAPAAGLLVPSLATAAAGIAAGARIVRAHDVAETVVLARMLAAARGGIARSSGT